MPQQTYTDIETVADALKGHNKGLKRNAWFEIEGNNYIVKWDD